jgi:hypothetical protein
MASSVRTLRVGVARWRPDFDVLSGIHAALAELGHEAVAFDAYGPLPDGLDVIVAHGPLGSLTPLAQQLAARHSADRPALALWMSEPWVNPGMPEWLRRSAAGARATLERAALRSDAAGNWSYDPRLAPAARFGWRLRNYGELHRLRARGLLNVLAVSSAWTAERLREAGFDPLVAYLGYQTAWGPCGGGPSGGGPGGGGPSGGGPGGVRPGGDGPRDVDVLWLGMVGSGRRRALLEGIRAALAGHGITLMVVDGQENPYVLGDERTQLLNRTSVMLNLLREPWDNTAMRFFLAASHRCLIVTEPTLPHTPLRPGVHLVEAPADALAGEIVRHLSAAQLRQPLVDAAHQLVTEELTLRRSVEQILAATNQGS